MNKKKRIFFSIFSIVLTILFIGMLTWGLIYSFGPTIDKTNYWVFVISLIYVAQIITSFYILNSKKRIINVRMCWIFVIFIIPLFGMFAFFIFGLIPFKIKTLNETYQENKRFAKYEDYQFTNNVALMNKDYHIFHYGYYQQLSPIYQKNKITILKQSQLFEESLKIIRSAEKFIHFQFYIVTDCIWFNLLIEEVIKVKKEKKIEVRFLYDWVGCHKRLHHKTIKYLRENGIQVEMFNPKFISKYTSATNFRSHRKSIIVDNKYCITGGSNIGDEYINLRKKYANWVDLNFLLEGEIVNSINLRFCNDWIHYSSYKKRNSKDNFYSKFIIHKANNNTVCQMINSTPEFKPNSFESLLSQMISRAKKCVWISTPYLLLPEHIISQLITAAISGIDVKIIIPNAPDDKNYILTINRNSSEKLIDSHVQIYEYTGFVHSKAVLIDDDISIIGSNNMDFRSLMINFESAILVKDVNLNKQLKDIFTDYMFNSYKVDKEFLRKNYKLSGRIQMLFISIIHPLL